MTELKTLSLRELERLATRIQKELTLRSDKRLVSVRKQVEKMAALAGLSVKDLLGDKPQTSPRSKAKAGKAKGKSKAKVAPKFAHPSNPQLTWSGRGRQPAWVAAWLETGRSLEGLAIAAQKSRQQPVVVPPQVEA